ncbi:MAG: nucleoside triphosphate pyrophosphohydrolase [Chloroflexi bacterium HGW-Chloroflexi-8]|nr:MAG: nucleoside triphosphate pyrophosphohydrolase [Chloroflexi bacterium HGW-Chloroflexi-8]
MTELFRGITILGLGPAGPELLTNQTVEWLNLVDELYLRTIQHPAVAGLPKSIKIHSFDSYYEKFDKFEDVYLAIVDEIIRLAHEKGSVTYAVPGHPFVAESTSPEIVKRAKLENIPVRVMEAVSFLEPTFTALGLDPFPNLILMDALELASANFPQFPPNRPVLVAQIYSRMVAAEVKQTLLEVFPDEHPVKLIHGAGSKSQKIEEMCLYEIDRNRNIGILTSLYIEPLLNGTSFEEFQELIAHLRAPDGCPWDREQDHQSLRKHLLSETYEALAALDEDNPEHICEELGDLLLQIVLHAQIASELGEFRMTDVLKGIYDKIIRRHPHVFTDLEVDGVKTVLSNWEKIKEGERKSNGKIENNGLLSGVPLEYPALAQSQEIQDRAARVGFDWETIEPVFAKVYEELDEVKKADTEIEIGKELGDSLFAMVNLVRWYKKDSETLLRETNLRFRNRFNFMENEVKLIGKSIQDFSLEELDKFWDKAKKKGL